MDRKVKIRITVDESPIFGPGKANLLDAIREEGSISAGARKIGMSYRRAWMLIDSINKNAKEKIIETFPGGRGGGGAYITNAGKKLLATYRNMENKSSKAIEKEKLLLYTFFK